MKHVFLTTICSLLAAGVFAQSGGTFSVTSSVIASGGGDASGAVFSASGTAGQPSAGGPMNGPGFTVRSGFWQLDARINTAAGVSISGRVVGPYGRGLGGARIALIDTGSTRTLTSSSRGFFEFDDVEVGRPYILQVESDRHTFAPIVVIPTDSMTALTIRPQP